MRIWLISDTHFEHANIIDYCNRPFKDIKEMEEEIIKRWNNAVKKDDIIYHLGDFTLSAHRYKIKELVSKLNGRLRLILGNHDRFKAPVYTELGFDRAYDKPIILDDFVVLSHEPIFMNLNCPFVNIFGHVHDGANYSTVTSTGACVCVERTNYSPILYNDILGQIRVLRSKAGKNEP